MSEKETQEPWLIDEGKNDIFVMLGNERVRLRCTQIQYDRYIELVEANQAEKETNRKALEKAVEEAKANGEKIPEAPRQTLKDNLIHTRMSSLDVAYIAMNDKVEIKYTKADIESHLDVDRIFLLAQKWLQRKIFEPTIEQDPLLRPAATVASLPGRK